MRKKKKRVIERSDKILTDPNAIWRYRYGCSLCGNLYLTQLKIRPNEECVCYKCKLKLVFLGKKKETIPVWFKSKFKKRSPHSVAKLTKEDEIYISDIVDSIVKKFS